MLCLYISFRGIWHDILVRMDWVSRRVGTENSSSMMGLSALELYISAGRFWGNMNEKMVFLVLVTFALVMCRDLKSKG